MPSDAYIGEIYTVAFNFAPRGYALCQGQLLPIAQNTALFSLVGTTYGGNGQTTFALPDLRGRVAVGVGAGPGLTQKMWGETGGVERVGLTVNELPSHTHSLKACNDAGDTSNPANAFPANTGALDKEYKADINTPVTMASNIIGATGGGNTHENMQPYLALYMCIATEGIFPSRN